MLEFWSAIGVIACLWAGCLVFLCDEDDIALSLRLTFYTLFGFTGSIFGIMCINLLVRTVWALI